MSVAQTETTLDERDLASPLGPLRLTVADGALVAIAFDPAGAPRGPGRDPLLDEAAAQLADYFAGRRTSFALPLAPRGTPFQRAVWDALLAIPHGQTRTYLDLAVALGRPTATRAVGAANGQNPLAIVVPCHRVIGTDGTLTGYAGGVERKRWLLAHEGALAQRSLF